MQNKTTTRSVIRSDIIAMHAYVVQDSKGYVKLDAMENPYTLSAPLQAELGKRLAAIEVNRYPGQRIHDLQNALAHYCNLPENYSLILGNGSDELISLLAIAIDQPGASIMAPLPGFVMYEMSAKIQGVKFIGIELDADFELDVDTMLQAIHTHQPALVYLAYPNNPTANLWSDEAMHSIIQACEMVGSLVVIDEAYINFSKQKSFVQSLIDYPNLVVLQTLSKAWGLAGLRLGMCFASPQVIGFMNKVKAPYNINIVTQELALQALDEVGQVNDMIKLLVDMRIALAEVIASMPHVIKVFPSDTNFLFVKIPHARKLYEYLLTEGIIVRDRSTLELCEDSLRITVGTEQENTALVDAMYEWITNTFELTLN